MARPCIVCGIRTDTGRCARHLSGGGRPRPCMVCGAPTGGADHCPTHDPKVDEAERRARQPYRKHYDSWSFRRNRQHRYERARGRCEGCGLAVTAGQWEAHHVVEIADGGGDDLENLRVLCIPCHRRITAARKGRRKR